MSVFNTALDFKEYKTCILSKETIKKALLNLPSTFEGGELINGLIIVQHYELAEAKIQKYNTAKMVEIAKYFYFRGETLIECNKELINYIRKYPVLVKGIPGSMLTYLDRINGSRHDRRIPFINFCCDYGSIVNGSNNYYKDQLAFLFQLKA